MPGDVRMILGTLIKQIRIRLIRPKMGRERDRMSESRVTLDSRLLISSESVTHTRRL
jgi:hypothetical protein